MIAAEAAEVADRVRNEVAVERGDAFLRLLTITIAIMVASGLLDGLLSVMDSMVEAVEFPKDEVYHSLPGLLIIQLCPSYQRLGDFVS